MPLLFVIGFGTALSLSGDPVDPGIDDIPGGEVFVPAIPSTGTYTEMPPSGYTLSGSYTVGPGYVTPGEAGIILSTNAAPSFSNGTKLTSSTFGTGSIEVTTGSLSADTTYYYRAYVDNDQTSASVMSFSTPPDNYAPTDITLGNSTFNQTQTAQISFINVTDPDSGDTHTFTLVAGTGSDSNSLFSIDGTFLRAAGSQAIPAGTHNIRIQATDNSGATFSKALTITAIDNLAPEAPTLTLAAASDSGTAGDHHTNVNRPTFLVDAETGSTVKLYRTGSPNVLVAEGVKSDPDNLLSLTLGEALADGQYIFEATATDALGNVSFEGSLSRSVIIDTVAPVMTSATTLNAAYGDAVSFRLTATGFPTTFLAPTGVPFGLNLAADGLISGTATTTGNQDVSFAVSDAQGNAVISTVTITVSPKQLTIDNLNGQSKNYDGNADASVRTDNATLSGVVSGDDVAADFSALSASFADANVENPKTMSVSGITLTGADAGKYTLAQPISVSSHNGIQRGTLAVTGLTAIDRVYNGTSNVEIDTSNAVLTGVASGEDVTIDWASSSAYIAEKERNESGASGFAGNNRPVYINISLTGTDTDNYYAPQSPTTTVNISPAPLTVTGITAADKIADGTTSATLNTNSAQLNGVVTLERRVQSETDGLMSGPSPSGTPLVAADIPGGTTTVEFVPDDVALDASSAVGTFASANPGSNVAVNITGLALTGTSAGNYTLTLPTTTATITPATQPQTITFEGPADKLSNSPAFDLEATASSELPVTFTVVSGPALISGSTVTPTGATGTVTVRADQEGNAEWDPAPSVTRTFEVTQVGPLVYFGTTTDGTEFAVNIPEGNTVGTLFGRIAATGQFYILTFQVEEDRSITALNLQILGDAQTTASALAQSPLRSQVGKGVNSPPRAAAALEYTFTGTLVGGVLNFNIAELGVTLTGTVEPANGETASLAGLYESSSLNSANGTTTSIVGTTGKVFVLAVTPTLITGGSGTIASNGTFNLQTNEAVTINGNVDAPSTTVSGTIILPDGAEDDFAGLSTDTLRTDRLINLSTRARIDSANGGTLITGFVVGGETPKELMLRAVGPTLADFGVTTAVDDPRIVVYNSSGTAVANSDNWGGSAETASVMARIGAFALPADSTDAVVVTSLDPGPYTMHVLNNGDPGVAIAEIYDASENPNSQYQRLVNISSRGNVTGGEGVLVGGFIVTGNSPKRVLVRGIGPTLADYGVSGALANPQLKVYNQDQQVVAINDDWSTPATVFPNQRTATAAEIDSANTAVGAFALGADSEDAALIITLRPGAYTVEISAADAGTGNALIEIYEIPE